MERDLPAAIQAQTASGTVYPALLVQIDYDDAADLAWSGIGPLTWGGKTFLGVGGLGGVSAISESTELRANGVVFSLSGIPAERVATVLAGSRYGLPAKMWLAVFDASGQLVGDPYLVFSGLTDVPTIEDGADTATISISAESRMVTLEDALNRRYTPESQRLIDPTDRGFDFVAGLQDKKITFGRA